MIAEALELIAGRRAAGVLAYGIADAAAWEVGLACGGRVEVFIELIDPQVLGALRAARAANRPVALVTRLDGSNTCVVSPSEAGALATAVADALRRDQALVVDIEVDVVASPAARNDLGARSDSAVESHARNDLGARSASAVASHARNDLGARSDIVVEAHARNDLGARSDSAAESHARNDLGARSDSAAESHARNDLGARSDSAAESQRNGVLVEPHNPPARLVVIGAVHVAQPLAEMARLAGLMVTIVDPRRAWATAARFPGLALVTEWPDVALESLALDARSAVVTLTHDPKLDDPALIVALRSPAFYIGCLGSKKTHAARRERLAAAGFDEAALARLHGPVGLRIGARSPAEIAVSILGELIAALRGAA